MIQTSKNWIYLTFIALLLSGEVEAINVAHSSCVIRSSLNNAPKAFFDVECPQTTVEKEKGLMFRKKLDSNHGMIFLYDPPKIVKFWMKNTEIPLDVLFVDKNDRIISIYKNRLPGDLTAFGPNSKIHAVLEISAGCVQTYNLKVGDLLDYDKFK